MDAHIQTFRAAHPRAALDAVRAALGPEAIILSTREVGGGLLRAPEMEVTAARPASAGPMQSLPPRPAGGGNRPIIIPRQTGAELEALWAQEPALPMQWERPAPQTSPLFLKPQPPPPDDQGQPRVVARLVEELTEGGVAPALARSLVEAARKEVGEHRPHMLREQLCQALLQLIPVGPAPWLQANRTMLCMVGATGTGKTTTLAKMAARARMQGRSVALISTDTYRVGAPDVLARYGDILGVTIHLARNRNELTMALNATRSVQLVLVDTAGRVEPSAVQRQVEMLGGHPGMKVLLTVAAVANHRDVAAAAARYGALQPAGVLCTKLDEACAPGCVLSAVDASRPLLGLTDGQNIPEDLHAADGLRLVERILP